MSTDLKNTDAYILMQFGDAIAHLKGKPLGEVTAEIGVIGRPFFDQLRAKGHDFPDAVGLLRAVWVSINRS